MWLPLDQNGSQLLRNKTLVCNRLTSFIPPIGLEPTDPSGQS